MLNQWDADPFTHLSSYTNTILAKQCIIPSDKLVEKFTQFRRLCDHLSAVATF